MDQEAIGKRQVVPPYSARFAVSDDDIGRAQRLRYRAFIDGTGAEAKDAGRDADAFDEVCRHVLVEDSQGALVATCRLLPLASGAEIGRSYSAQYYTLDRLESYKAPMAELGRFCVEPGVGDADVLRVAWSAVAKFVDAEGIEMIFGCSSFKGTETAQYSDAFAMLKDRHLAPRRWWPRVKAPKVFRFARRQAGAAAPDPMRALKTMPPLLRSYLTLGGWVSDHAVVDTDMNTLHVFTGLEIKSIPPRRAKLLRGLAG